MAAPTGARTLSFNRPVSDRRSATSSRWSWSRSRRVSKWRMSSVDQRDPEKRYLPGHPDADKDGYVAFPRMNPAEDMVDLMGATRNYGANIAAISAVKDMIQRSIDLMR